MCLDNTLCISTNTRGRGFILMIIYILKSMLVYAFFAFNGQYKAGSKLVSKMSIPILPHESIVI